MVGGLTVHAGDMVGEHLRLFPQRRDQAIDLPAMLRAFPDGIDVHVVQATHMVVDDNGTFDRQSRGMGNFHIRLDAGRHHDHVAIQRLAVLEGQAGDAILAQDLGRRFVQVDAHAHLFHHRAQDARAGAIELRRHQVVAKVDDMRFAAVVQQAARRFQDPAAHRR